MRKTIATLCTCVVTWSGVQADNQPAAPAAVSCPTLSADEQQFAAQMTADHQTMFCAFTAEQRQAVMQMVGKPDSNGNPMNADSAMAKMMQTMMPSTQPKASGGCPMK